MQWGGSYQCVRLHRQVEHDLEEVQILIELVGWVDLRFRSSQGWRFFQDLDQDTQQSHNTFSLVELRCASAGSPGALEKAAVVFADPPYAGSPQQSLAALLGCAVADAGCWCLELSADAAQPQLPVGVATVLDRVYGGSRLIIYERAAP